MREANDRGYECLLAEDATESYFPEFKAATLAMIRAQGGIVGWTAPTDTIVEARSTADCRHGSRFRRLRSRATGALAPLAIRPLDGLDLRRQGPDRRRGPGDRRRQSRLGTARQTPAARSAPAVERLLRAGASAGRQDRHR